MAPDDAVRRLTATGVRPAFPAPLTLLALLALLALAALVAGCGPRTTASGPVAPPTRAQVAATLAERAAGQLLPGSPLAALPVTAWSYDVRSVTPGPGPAATVLATLHYRLAGDAVDVTAARVLVVAADPAEGGAVRVRSERPDGAALPWDLGPVRWTSGPAADVLWTGTADAPDLPAVARQAAGAVTAAWGSPWQHVPVVVAVTGPSPLARVTGRPVAGPGLVAVTTADRVYVDVAAYAGLSAEGRRVLLTHELTHLATGAAADPGVPQWLEEGFADHVGLSGSTLALGEVAGPLLARVRASGAPAALPADADFTAGGATEAEAYAGAWLACRLIAARVGERALVAVYRATSAAGRADPGAGPDADADAALVRVTGHGTAWWTDRWRADLARTAGPAGR